MIVLLTRQVPSLHLTATQDDCDKQQSVPFYHVSDYWKSFKAYEWLCRTQSVWYGKPTKTSARKVMIALYRWITETSIMEEISYLVKQKTGT